MKWLTECGALIAHIAIHAIKLRVVPNVENIASEFHVQPLRERSLFREAHVRIVDAGPAAD